MPASATQMEPAAASGPASTTTPKSVERWALVGLLAAFLCLDLATFNLYPTVWCDDVTWSDAAINLATTGHFTTSVWQFQPAGTFWSVNPPLYPLLLSGWVRVFGASVLGVRSFNFLLLKIAILLTWFISWKGRFTSSAWQRWGLAALLECGYGLTFAYRCSRPDILGLISVLLAACALLIERSRAQRVLLFCAAFCSVWIGLQVALYLWLLCLAGWVLFHRLAFTDLLILSLGIGLGACLLAGFYAWHHALPYLLNSVLHVASEHTLRSGASGFWGSLPRRLSSALHHSFADFSLLCLLGGLVYLCLVGWKSFQANTKQAVGFALLVLLGVPLIFSLIAHFAFYYSYMLFVPVALTLCRVYSRLVQNASTRPIGLKSPDGVGLAVPQPAASPARFIFALSVTCAILVGLPLRLLLTAHFCRLVPRREISRVLRSAVRPDDVVFTEYAYFFETRQIATKVYTPMYSKDLVNLSDKAHGFSPEEKRAIDVLIIQPQSEDFLAQYFGGDWESVSPVFGDSFSLEKISHWPVLGYKIEQHFQNPQTIRIQVQVFRRKSRPT